MPSKAIKPKRRRSLQGVSKALENTQTIVGRTMHMRSLQNIVAPFETDIPFEAVDVSFGDVKALRIRPERTATTINAAGDAVAAADVFFWLDKGTDIRFVTLPDDFERESSPNSTSTTSASYDRDEVVLDTNNPQDGIEPRNFMRLVGEERESIYFRRMRQTFIRAVAQS